MLEEFIKQLSQYGLLGVVLAIVAWAVFYLWKDLRSSWEARIIDNKHLVEVVEATNKTYLVLAQSIEHRAKAIEMIADAQTATAAALERHTELLRKVSNREDHLEVLRLLDRAAIKAEALNNNIERLLHELRT